ncbi:uncharacterized protein VTP21DRAFT_8231 [Calcarisporiella thermophila]|uniref:uncharacterized protein n=1 Tax=Calcarisporiella thermophila TaxID=911321 RepID=UPI0037446CAF
MTVPIKTASSNIKKNVTVRPFSPSNDEKHFERIRGLINSAYRSDKSWTTEKHLIRGERMTIENLRRTLENDSIHLFLASIPGNSAENKQASSEDELIVGTVDIEFNEEYPGAGLLGCLAVDPEFQSHGIGSRLVSHAMHFAKEQLKLSKMVIWVVDKRSDIIGWYERLGFKKTMERRPFVWPNLIRDGIELDFIVLEKAL